MKYILLLVIVAGFGYVGWSLSAYYRRRLKFFNEILMLLSRLKIEINFSKDALMKIFSGCKDNYNKDINKLINNYITLIKSNEEISKENLLKTFKFLTDDEKQTLAMFFKNLGRCDSISQTAEIENFCSKFNEFKLAAEFDNKRYGSIYFKLFLLMGGALALVLL